MRKTNVQCDEKKSFYRKLLYQMCTVYQQRKWSNRRGKYFKSARNYLKTTESKIFLYLNLKLLISKDSKNILKFSFRFFLSHGDLEYLFKFDSLENIQRWKVNSDAGYEIGNSEVSFDLTEQKTGMFKGVIVLLFKQPLLVYKKQ